jgi:hypothetical protein
MSRQAATHSAVPRKGWSRCSARSRATRSTSAWSSSSSRAPAASRSPGPRRCSTSSSTSSSSTSCWTEWAISCRSRCAKRSAGDLVDRALRDPGPTGSGAGQAGADDHRLRDDPARAT